MTRMYLYSFVTFTRKEVCGTHLVFTEGEISRFGIRNFEGGKSFGRTVHFFNSLGTARIPRSFKLFVYIDVVLLMNFQEQLEPCFYFKYSRSYEVL